MQAQSTVGKGVDATGNDIGVREAGATGVKGDGGSIGVHGIGSVYAGRFEGNVIVEGSKPSTWSSATS
jgi:hypothetical protein